METEIKLLLTPAGRATIEAHPLLAAAPPRREAMVSVYYDTPDLALRARGLTLRVRSVEGEWVQTVKSRDGGTSFASRGEWEWPLASEALDPDALRREPDAARLIGNDVGRVAPAFATHVARDLRRLTLDGGTAVELAIDEGEVRAGGRTVALHEMELELKEGPVGPMLRLAEELSRVADLRLGTEAKSDRGYALLTGAPAPQGAAPGADLSRSTLGEAFPSLMGACTRDIAADLSAAARGDVDGVHRLRAAIRKARTLVALFAPHLDADTARRFDAELGDFGRVLGAGRDWDVFTTETLAAAQGEIGAPATGMLRAAGEQRRSAVHAAVRAAAEGPAPTRLLLGLALWTADAGWLADGEGAELPIREVLPGLLDRLERKALKRGRHLKSASVDELHGLRKGLKKLRYACEDVAPLFDGGETRRYVGRIKAVLADLGSINDAAVTEERVGDLEPRSSVALAAAAEALLAWNDRRRRGSRRDLRRHWRKLRHADPFWS